MALKLNKEAINAFQTELSEIDHSLQDTFNLRETVRESFKLIQRARAYKASWEKIAEILQRSAQANGINIAINPESLKIYFLEVVRELPKKKRKIPGKPNGANFQQTQTKDRVHRQTSQVEREIVHNKIGVAPFNLQQELDAISAEPQVNHQQEKSQENQMAPTSAESAVEKSSEIPQRTTSGWVEPKINRNRVRPKKD